MQIVASERTPKSVEPVDLDPVDRRLLDEFQRGFPLAEQPFLVIADAFGLSEEDVLARYRRLTEAGYITRIGAIVRPHAAGWSTLAAMAVPEDRLDEVAGLVSSFPEVNHNYEREHEINLWFVVTGCDAAAVAATLAEIEERTGCEVLDLPLEEPFCLDLGFRLAW